MTQKIIIAEMGYGGVSRFGFHTDGTFHEINLDVRDSSELFPGDFAKLMNAAYATLNVTNPADHPVLVIEKDGMNSWRRPEQAKLLMGEKKAPWMYVMRTCLILAYANNKNDLGTALVSHMEENGDVHEVPVIGGWPQDFRPYMQPPRMGDWDAETQSRGEWLDRYYYEPQTLEVRADVIYWCQAACPHALGERKDLLNNIILSGKGWENKLTSEADIHEVESRLDNQRAEYDHKAVVNRPSYPRSQCVWRASQKICNDGILLDWDLAFTQAHFQANGADYIRQWVF